MAAPIVFQFLVFSARYFAKNVCFMWKSSVLSRDEYLALGEKKSYAGLPFAHTYGPRIGLRNISFNLHRVEGRRDKKMKTTKNVL